MGVLRHFVICAVILFNCRESKAQIERIRGGFNIFKSLADAFSGDEITKSLGTISKVVGSFTGVVSPIVDLFLSFTPTGNSVEMKYMMEKFLEVNKKLDTFDAKFEEIKLLLQWNKNANSYTAEEKAITTMKTKLNEILHMKKGTARHNEARQNKIKLFIADYAGTYRNSGTALFNGLMRNDLLFTNNLMMAIIRRTRFDRRSVGVFGKGLLRLLCMSCEIELANLVFQNMTVNILEDERKWKSNITAATQRVKEIDEYVKNKWHKQLKNDTDAFAIQNARLDSKPYSKKLYNFLSKKYYWRYVFVMVYPTCRISEYSDWHHAFRLCGGGISKFDDNGKNLVVETIDKSKSVYHTWKADVVFSTAVYRQRAETILAGIKRLFFFNNKCTDFALAGVTSHRVQTYVNAASGHYMCERLRRGYSRLLYHTVCIFG